MTIGPAPMIRIEEMSVRLGMSLDGRWAGSSVPISKFANLAAPLMRTSESKGHQRILDSSAVFGFEFQASCGYKDRNFKSTAQQKKGASLRVLQPAQRLRPTRGRCLDHNHGAGKGSPPPRQQANSPRPIRSNVHETDAAADR